LQDADDVTDLIVNPLDDGLDTRHLEVDELIDRILRGVVLLANLDLLVDIWLVNCLPKLNDRSQLLCPLCLVEPQLLSASGSESFEAQNDLIRVEPLDGSVDIDGESEDFGAVLVWNPHYGLHEIVEIAGLGRCNQTRQLLTALHRFVLEDRLHVSSQNTHVKFIIDSATVNSVLKNTVDLLPSDLTTLSDETGKDLFTSHEITVGELVVLDPALRDVSSSFLQQGVEPGKDEQKLSLLVASARLTLRHDVLERALEVVLHARRGLICDLETRLQKNRRELQVRLRGKPESEFAVRLQHLKFLFENGEPRRDQVQILKADPFSLLSGHFDRFDSDVILSATHSKLMVPRATDHLLSELLQFSTWVGARRNDEENRISARSLILIQVFQDELGRLYRLVVEGLSDELSHR
jgi:hypothetical protein